MKHLKLFENNSQKKLYLCFIVEEYNFSINDRETTIFAFYNEIDRSNFLINYIHKNFIEAEDDSIDDIFDIDQLINEYNEYNDNKIYLNDANILENVKLNAELEIRMSGKKYNL